MYRVCTVLWVPGCLSTPFTAGRSGLYRVWIFVYILSLRRFLMVYSSWHLLEPRPPRLCNLSENAVLDPGLVRGSFIQILFLLNGRWGSHASIHCMSLDQLMYGSKVWRLDASVWSSRKARGWRHTCHFYWCLLLSYGQPWMGIHSVYRPL